MGPRLFSRGNDQCRAAGVAVFVLQWGRGSSAAEMALLATSYHYCHYVYDFER